MSTCNECCLVDFLTKVSGTCRRVRAFNDKISLLFANLYRLFVCPSITHELPRQISIKFCTDICTNWGGKVLNRSMTMATQPLATWVTQPPKPDQVIGEKRLLYKKYPDECSNTFCQNELLNFCSPSPGMRGYW